MCSEFTLQITRFKDWLLQFLDDICHRKCLAGTRDAEKGLEPVTFFEAFDQLGDGLRAVAGAGRMVLSGYLVFHYNI